MAQHVEAVVAQLEAELVFTPGVKTAMALVAGGIVWTLALLADANFGMNFKLDHKLPQNIKGTRRAILEHLRELNSHDLRGRHFCHWGI
jgi:hypothetical protein